MPDLTLLDCPCKDFIFLGKVPEPMPAFHSKYIMLFGICFTGDWVISSNNREGFKSNLPSLPFQLTTAMGVSSGPCLVASEIPPPPTSMNHNTPCGFLVQFPTLIDQLSHRVCFLIKHEVQPDHCRNT